MKPGILIAGDSAHARFDLREAFDCCLSRWSVQWAADGTEAAKLLAAEPTQVLITDPALLGPDGESLLAHVRHQHPSTARIVLVSAAEQEAALAVAGTGQQFLRRTCDAEDLIATVEAVLVTQELIADPHLRELLGGLENLPKPPAIYAELCSLAQSSTASAADIARVLERDVATTAELLKLVNSALFGLASEVTSVRRAVTLLGLDVVQALVVAGRVFGPAGTLPDGLVAADIAAQGIKACSAVRRAGVAMGWDDALTGQASLAALLHDVGLLALAANDPVGWGRYTELRTELPRRAAEEQAFGCTVGRASAYILGLWGFSPVTVGLLAEQPIDIRYEVARDGGGSAALIVAGAHQAAAPTEGRLSA